MIRMNINNLTTSKHATICCYSGFSAFFKKQVYVFS